MRDGRDSSGAAREERGEMLGEEERAKGVDLESGQSLGLIDLGGRLFRVENAGDAIGEAEIGAGEARLAVGCYMGDGAFVCLQHQLQLPGATSPWVAGEMIPVTSSFRTSSLSLSTSRPCSIRSLVCSRSLREVAMMGKSVVFSRRLASCRPMPRDAGDTKTHGFAILECRGIYHSTYYVCHVLLLKCRQRGVVTFR